MTPIDRTPVDPAQPDVEHTLLTIATGSSVAALTLAGRKDAFATIMQRHRDAIYRLVKSHVGEPEDALAALALEKVGAVSTERLKSE